MQKKQTAANQRTAEMQLAKEQVCMLLELSSYDYNEMQYHCGLSFLAYKCQGEFSEGRIVGSKIFWSWWVNNWAMRDEVFLEENQNMQVDENGNFIYHNWVNKSAYLLCHNPYELSSKIDKYGEMFHKAWLQILNIINNDAIKQAV
jgi:hypothetical protein